MGEVKGEQSFTLHMLDKNDTALQSYGTSGIDLRIKLIFRKTPVAERDLDRELDSCIKTLEAQIGKVDKHIHDLTEQMYCEESDPAC